MTYEAISAKAPLRTRGVRILVWTQLGIAILAIAAWGFVALQLKPLLNARDSLKEELAQMNAGKEQLGREIQEKEKQLSQYDEALAQIRDELNTFKKRIEASKKELETHQYELARKTLTEAVHQVPSVKLDWFTVIGTYPELNEARKYAKRIAEVLALQKSAYPIEIYKTKISNSYAVTLGGKLERSNATELAKFSRTNNFSPDAFAQVDRQWEVVVKSDEIF